MKICIFTHTFPRFPGDTAAPFMGNFAEALCRQGHEVTVLLPFDTNLIKRPKAPYKLEFYRYIFPESLHKLGYSRTLKGDKGLKPEAYFLSLFLLLFGFLALFRLVKNKKIDIISSHWIIPNGFIAALVYKITGVPFIVTIPGSDVYLGGKNRLFHLMIEVASRGARVVLSDNSAYISQLRRLGIHPKKTSVIPYGVNLENFKPTKKDKNILKKLSIDNKSLVVLAVGRLVAKKGFLYLIEAIPEVLKSNTSAKLIIVGDGDQKEELLDRVEKLSLEKSVSFVGMISYDQLSKYYNIGDVFVMPSVKDDSGNIDASPVAMMEAISCGVPVVATKFAGSRDFIEQGKTGFLVKEKDSGELAKAITLLLNKSDRVNLKKMVRKIALENFSTQSVAKKYTEVLRLATYAG